MMKKILINPGSNILFPLAFVLSFLSLFPLPSAAQIPSGYVQTTATVPALANGTFGASWTNLSSSPQLGLLGCVSTFQTTVSGAFNAYGKISVLLADTAQICPSPSTWTFNFTFACSTGQTPSTFQIQVAVTGGGGTEDISSQITAALPATSCSGGGGGGGGNLSGSGTAGFIPLWTGLHALGNSPADYNVTTPSAFTFPYRVDVGGVPAFSMNLGPLSTMTASWNLDTTTPATALASLGATQSANTVWAGPASGSPGAPGWRALVAADVTGLIASLSYQTVAANGTAQTQRPTLNFSPRFAVSDSSSPAETNVDFAATGVTAGTYSNPTIIFDAYGRATSATNGAASPTIVFLTRWSGTSCTMADDGQSGSGCEATQSWGTTLPSTYFWYCSSRTFTTGGTVGDRGGIVINNVSQSTTGFTYNIDDRTLTDQRGHTVQMDCWATN